MKRKKAKPKKNKTIWLAILLFGMVLAALGMIQVLNPETGSAKNYCTAESRNADACIELYDPVCGWFGQDVQCLRYPCADTYSNSCFACMNENVEYWTEGECPDEMQK